VTVKSRLAVSQVHSKLQHTIYGMRVHIGVPQKNREWVLETRIQNVRDPVRCCRFTEGFTQTSRGWLYPQGVVIPPGFYATPPIMYTAKRGY